MKADSPPMSVGVWLGAVVTGIAYVVTHQVVISVHKALTGSGQNGLDRAWGPALAVGLTVVPYLVCGLYCRYTKADMPKLYPLWTALLATSFERMFIYGVGYLLFARGGDGFMLPGSTVLGFIQGEAAPYFTWPYIVYGGISSVAITAAIGAWPGKRRT